MRCPRCGDVYVADPGHRCTACGVALEDVPERRRRTAPATVPLAPEAIREEVTARIRRIATEDAAAPVPERVVFSWPDHDPGDDEITAVLPVAPFPGPERAS